MVDFSELHQRAEERAAQSPVQIFKAAPEVKRQMRGTEVKVRESLASPTNPNPLPVAVFLDTTGSMGHVPEKLAKKELIRLLQRSTAMGAMKGYEPQINFCGIADTADPCPIQLGQFEADNRMDGWLTALTMGGGGGSDHEFEAYPLALYFLSRMTRCSIWDQNKKGYAIIVGDEMCPPKLLSQDVERIFGREASSSIPTAELVREVQEKWNLYFCYVQTRAYGQGRVEPIGKSWEKILPKENLLWLDEQATGLPEVISALIGTNEGFFKREDVPQMLRELADDEANIKAVAKALGVDPGRASVEREGPAKPRKRGMQRT